MTTARIKPITDNTTVGLFRHGFETAIALWRSGTTTEAITHEAQTAEPRARGMVAACDAILGWIDLAEREARAHGMTREEATAYVSEQLDAIDIRWHSR